ncbi:hypothetical protein ZIOFF_040395 [Zingiber officinale]|uniref:C2 domain-containing protein n=1 Tax=Zingiber officinale TaxID=94328 RepID=A0A8J5L0Z3_ZINOF|nr:hypothetical protein ZIOFF_040395 [Zingiber officinale]
MSFGELEVLLVDAKGLKDTDLIGKMDPYAEIQYRDQQQKSKVAYKEGGNPRWNQKFKFKVVLRVMDRDTFSADDFVGEATINVGDVIAMGMEKGFMEVNPCNHPHAHRHADSAPLQQIHEVESRQIFNQVKVSEALPDDEEVEAMEVKQVALCLENARVLHHQLDSGVERQHHQPRPIPPQLCRCSVVQ